VALSKPDMVRWVNEYCIAVALTDSRYDTRGAGALLGQGVVGGGNGIWLATPAGTQLAGNSELYKGLENWIKLSDKERKADAAQVEKLLAANPPKAGLTPPKGGLILKFYERYLDRDAKGELGHVKDKDWDWWGTYAEPQHDYMWLTQAEWKSLVPASAKKGDNFPVPEAISKRFFEGYIVCQATGTGPRWEWSEMATKELTLTVQEVSADGVRLRLQGHMKAKNVREVLVDIGKSIYEKSEFVVEARLLGYLDYDAQKKAFTRFDVVAVGDARGKAGFSHPGFRPGPHGWTFQLVTGDSWRDRVPPSTPFRQLLHGIRLL
jgi:hypothetical protein